MNNDNGVKSGLYSQQKRIELALKLATIYYSTKIIESSSGNLAKQFLMKRRIKPETAFKFKIGFAPNPTFAQNTVYQNSKGKNFR